MDGVLSNIEFCWKIILQGNILAKAKPIQFSSSNKTLRWTHCEIFFGEYNIESRPIQSTIVKILQRQKLYMKESYIG